MKSGIKKLLTVICVLVSLIGCESSTESQIKQDINGSWLLVKRFGGYAGITEIIDTKKDRYVLNYYRNNTAVLFYNDTLLWVAYYKIEKKKSSYSAEDIFTIVYENKYFSDIISHVSEDTLSLSDNYADGFSKLYTRIH